MTAEQIETRSKKVRGMAQRSLDLIEAMYAAAEAAQPITGRGIGYKLFTAGLIPSMARAEMQRVYRLLKEAREQGVIPWDWIVDETRALERVLNLGRSRRICPLRRAILSPRLLEPAAASASRCGARRAPCAACSQPVLDQYAVGFRVMHGFSGATTVHDVAEDDDGRDLIVLYVGDYDPSGLYMSEDDLPERLAKYGGDHVTLKRIALTRKQADGLPSFPATDKSKDPRYKWFVRNYGDRCWELDAMDPNDLRDCVEEAIRS